MGKRLKNINRWHNRRHLIGARDGWVCRYCGVDLYCLRCEPNRTNGVVSTLDHVTALSHGGNNSPDNLVMACQRCNAEQVSGYGKRRRERALSQPTPGKPAKRPKPNRETEPYPIVWDSRLKTFVVDRKNRLTAWTPEGRMTLFDSAYPGRVGYIGPDGKPVWQTPG